MKTKDERKSELQAELRRLFAKLDVQNVLVSRGRVAVMGHEKGQPKTLAHFVLAMIAVHMDGTAHAELVAWVEEVRRVDPTRAN